MSEWNCQKGYEFKLFPEIGTWGCYDLNGNYIAPINTSFHYGGNILLIVFCLLMIYLLFKNNKLKNKEKIIKIN
jgi:hypothetical protein